MNIKFAENKYLVAIKCLDGSLEGWDCALSKYKLDEKWFSDVLNDNCDSFAKEVPDENLREEFKSRIRNLGINEEEVSLLRKVSKAISFSKSHKVRNSFVR